MLIELSIEDFAIIDQTTIQFDEGITVLTGETGAGKSIIIDAIQLLAGGRGSVEFVRYGAKKAEIEGLFVLDDINHPIYTTAEQYGVNITEDQVVLKRVITENGKSICRVNGKLVTLGILREFGKTLIDIHSQHETQSLMEPEHHIDLLDLYDQQQIEKSKEEYLLLFEKLTTLKKRYKEFNENEKEMVHRMDLLQFQLTELEKAQLEPGEDEVLEKERIQLANFDRVFHGIQDAYQALYGEGKGIEWLNIAQQALQDNRQYDAFIDEKAEELTNYYFMIEEITFSLRNYSESLAYHPDKLNDIEARLDEISRLKRKYGATVNDMLEYMADIEEELEQIHHKDTHLIKLEQEIKELEQDVFLEAKQLHDLRKKAAKALTKEVHEELRGLYLDKASFEIQFKPDHVKQSEENISLHKNGFDHVRFLISTNPGEPLKQIDKIASGGELSRIMLVLKKIFAKHQGVTSVIFDEVDTGVSGRVAQAIAEKIYQISLQSQVLCITHLPQVAAMADTHKLIEKKETNDRHATRVIELSPEQQTEELSRMITGTKVTDTAREHAKELLQSAAKFKQNQNQK